MPTLVQANKLYLIQGQPQGRAISEMHSFVPSMRDNLGDFCSRTDPKIVAVIGVR
jgi:hypothetical protein